MSNFSDIQVKLQEFVKKYYTNELIKGLILFCSFGFLYFILTVFIEYFLWLNPISRTFLFWIFVVVETALFFKYIIKPILKLVGVQKGISIEEASVLIGKHFNEIDDKLLNVIQLKKSNENSELLLASIEQKSEGLKPIPFRNAVNFRTNKKYLKFLAVPFVIWMITIISGNISLFSQSYKRVINYETVYLPPAPFSFEISNNSFDVIEGDSFIVQIKTKGEVIPEDVRINFDNQSNFVKNKQLGNFEYTFSAIQNSVDFFVEANGVRSKNYRLNVIKTPTIVGFEMSLDYPSYTEKQDEVIRNTGNVTIPSGTTITWKVQCRNTLSVAFKGGQEELFEIRENDLFEIEKRLLKSLDYRISTNNKELEDYESLNFSARVIPDAYPKIEVRSDIDSIKSGPAQFVGQLSDDYGISKLELVYYGRDDKENKRRLNIPVMNSVFEEFYYVFPDGIELIQGVEYEMFFSVVDNDGVNGNKSSKSRVFSYYNKTDGELNELLLEEQGDAIEQLEDVLKKSKDVKEDFKNLQESLQRKSEMNWNDQKKLENFVKRQEQYQKMMQEQTEELIRNIENQPKSEDKSVEEKKRELKKRLDEAKEMSKQDELLKELEKLAEKLDKEELTEKLKKLSQNNRQNERNLERLLELTKRFYVEQKANQIKKKIDELADKQENASDSEKNNSEKQEELNSKFDEIKKELDNLEKENEMLQKPLDLPDTEKGEKKIDDDMKEALEELEKAEENEGSKEPNKDGEQNKKNASRKQKMAAQKLKKMSEQMQSAMQSMQGESMNEDIEMLRAILENLVEFSFQQEDLLNAFSESNAAHPEFGIRLKKQNVLKEYFEHIDDSLYTLALRQPKIGSTVFKELADVHFYLDESLGHLANNQYNVGVSDQQFVMTSTNNIAVLLSNILNAMQNASPSMGKGDGDSFSLPDVIKKQGESIKKLEDGMKKKGEQGKKGEENEPSKKGEDGKEKNSSGEGEMMNGELYEIYKEQLLIREMLEENIKNKISKKKGVGENVLKQMEQLEKELLDKGFSRGVLARMKNLKYELIKLEEASYKQGEDSKRESSSGVEVLKKKLIRDLDPSKIWINENELLIRQSLPLRANYKLRVQNYFRINDSVQ